MELFSCKECDKVFTTKEALETHKQRHPANDVIKKHRCNFCSYSTQYSSHLRKHIFTHTGERPYKCNECTAGFTQNSLLRKHMLKHAVRQVVHKCERCYESFEDKKALEKHAKVHKKDTKKYRCFYCSKRFYKSSSLLKHEKKHSQDDSSASDQDKILSKCKTKSKSSSKNLKKPSTNTTETPSELREEPTVSVSNIPENVGENPIMSSKDISLNISEEQTKVKTPMVESKEECHGPSQISMGRSTSMESAPTSIAPSAPTSAEPSSTHWKKKKMSSQQMVWSPARDAVESKSFNFLEKKTSDVDQDVSLEIALNLSKKQTSLENLDVKNTDKET